MEDLQTGTEKVRFGEEQLLCLILEWEAKTGLTKWDYSFGQILYMLYKLQERDQISWACSAQDGKFLPKKVKKSAGQFKQKLETQISRFKWPEKTSPQK